MRWDRSAHTQIARAFAHAGAFGAACFALSGHAAAADTLALRGTSEVEHETPVTCTEGAGACFTLLGVAIDGANAFTQADLSRHYLPYLARSVSLDDLARIADAITTRYRHAGYFLSHAIVPPQDGASGVARIVVLEGRIAEVVIEGDGRDQARAYVRGLDSQPVADLHDLDRRLALANDVPGLSVRSRIEPYPNDPTGHRLVVTTQFEAIDGVVSIDNRGSEDAGPLQAYGRVRTNSVLLAGDQISLGMFTTPDSPEDFTHIEGAYSISLDNGARVTATLAESRARDGHDMASPDIGGDVQALSLRYEHPLQRGRAAGLWLGAAFDLHHAENDWASGGGYADELRVARVSLRGFLDEGGRATTVFARASFGLDFLGASGRSLARRSRYDADGEFVALNLHASHYRDLSRHVGVYASIDGQWADRPLLLSEEFSVGSQPYGRAYNPGEISGDHGLAGLVELRAGFDPDLGPISFLQGYLFYDTAQVWNYNTAPDADELSLSSAGAGLRVNIEDWLIARWEFARPLTRTPFEQGDKDWRQFFSLAAAY
ncbi:MAG: POTRA domain-containing protein [Terricaulis sp.]